MTEHILTETAGSTDVLLEYGQYRFEINGLPLPVPAKTVVIDKPAVIDIGLDVQATLTQVHGHVTKGRAPVRAQVIFSTGSGVTNEDGYYAFTLTAAPGPYTVMVSPCDGGPRFEAIPPEPLADNATFDIEIPINEVAVTVVDAATRAPFQGAAVSVAPLFERGGPERYFFDNATVDSAGLAVVPQVPPNRWIRACAGHAAARDTCEEFLLRDEQRYNLTLRLARTDLFHGRVQSPVAIQSGKLYWVGPDGRTTERVIIAPDGTFTYQRKHASEDHLVVIARNLPLFATRPLSSGERLEVPIPAARLQSFTVLLRGEQADARLTITVDGLLVPSEAFGIHQQMKGQAVSIYGRAPVLVRDVLATGPINVLIGPSPSEVPPGFSPEFDPFSLPQFRVAMRVVHVRGATVEIP